MPRMRMWLSRERWAGVRSGFKIRKCLASGEEVRGEKVGKGVVDVWVFGWAQLGREWEGRMARGREVGCERGLWSGVEGLVVGVERLFCDWVLIGNMVHSP